MVLDEIKYQTYVQILKEELVPAMGCTEPMLFLIVLVRPVIF